MKTPAKNRSAQDLARQRWKNVAPDERQQVNEALNRARWGVWTVDQDVLHGKSSDAIVAAQIGKSAMSVFRRRKLLGIPPSPGQNRPAGATPEAQQLFDEVAAALTQAAKLKEQKQ